MVIKKRNYEPGNFTILDNSVIRDKNISLGARGLLHYMLSCTDQWHFTIDNLVVNTGAGKTKIETYMKELKYWGYLKLEKQNRDKGRFGNCDYIVSEYGNLDNPF